MEHQLVEILEQSLTDKHLLSVFVAFLGGVISSLSPCVLAILPIMIGYIGGYTENNISKAFFQSLLFVLGLTIILTIVGLIAALAGQVVGSFIGPAWYIILAILAIFMGLVLLEVFHFNFPIFIKDMPKNKYGSIIYPILIGMVFGTMATPCSTPILITILGYVTYQADLLLGTLMLIAYALGHGVLLIICGTFTGAIKQIPKIREWTQYITKGSGVILILIGIYLLIQGIAPELIPF